jgi:hypothetical protein
MGRCERSRSYQIDFGGNFPSTGSDGHRKISYGWLGPKKALTWMLVIVYVPETDPTRLRLSISWATR